MDSIKKWLKTRYNILFLINPTCILLNRYDGYRSDLINMYVLIIKFYIYKTKVQGNSLNFINAIADVNKIRQTEKSIAYKTNKCIKYNIRWSTPE